MWVTFDLESLVAEGQNPHFGLFSKWSESSRNAIASKGGEIHIFFFTLRLPYDNLRLDVIYDLPVLKLFTRTKQ